MKARFVVVAALLASLAATALTQEEKDALEKERQLARASQEAWGKFRKEAQAVFDRNFKGGFANYWHDAIDEARAMYEKALEDPVYVNRQKIDICRAIAQCHLEATRDGKAALAAVERPFAFAGLSAADREYAEKQRNDLRRAMGLVAEEPPPPKDEAHFADGFAKTGPNDRAFSGLFRAYAEWCADKGAAFFLDNAVKRAVAALGENPKSDCARTALQVAAGRVGRRDADYAFRTAGFAGKVLDFVEAAPADVRPDVAARYNYASSVRGAELEARRLAYATEIEKISKDDPKKVNANVQKSATKYLAFAKVDGRPGRAIDACRDYLKKIGKADDKVELAKLLAEQAAEFLRAGDESGARKIWSARAKIVPPRAQVKFNCVWWEAAPHDLRGIVESDFYKKSPKAVLSYKYGDNLKFLIETDSAITGREMTTDKGEKFRPSELFAFCDRQGVKFVLRQYLDNMEAIRAGYAGAPGVESYVAMGVDSPYHCVMFGASEDGKAADNFVTQYDNETGYRNTQSAKGTLKFSSLYLDDGVATLVAMPWTAAFASLPGKEPAWYVEFLNWAHGGMSLGGSISVHNRSSFAEMSFKGVDATALTAIKRTLLLKARNTFNETCAARANGFAEMWSDPELGDQAFYLAKVKPLLDELGPFAARVKLDMADDEVREVYDAAGERLLNIDYAIARLRREWLGARLTEE
ncbi:MAG: hypothetical protein IJ829_03655 [Kiritimatiellae bacterium]|nr:hypothetical protein [Kiritimatiellia bacterium]